MVFLPFLGPLMESQESCVPITGELTMGLSAGDLDLHINIKFTRSLYILELLRSDDMNLCNWTRKDGFSVNVSC